MNDHPQEVPLGPDRLQITLSPRRIQLPNGLYLRYDNILAEDLYGAKLLEHICQSLARAITMSAALRLAQCGHRFVTQAHDELVFCIPDDQLEAARTAIVQEMTRPPDWMPELPLAVEIKQGPNYGNCEIWEPT
jgi:hypothetical protein